jgi:hypothetical protein
MHEAGHRTAFASRALNDGVACWAGVLSFYNGVLSFYNADFYRRYTSGTTATPTWWVYLLELSAIPWWMGKVRGHLAGLRGDLKQHIYIHADAMPAL